MSANINIFRRPVYVVLALVILLAGVIPAIYGVSKAYAAVGQVTTRSMSMSTSQVGTAATYTVKFTPATTSTVLGVVLNFCDDSPLIGVSCLYTAGQSLNDLGTLGITSVVGPTDTTHWTAAVGSNNDTAGNGAIVVLTDSVADTFTSGTPVTFIITGFVNPSYSTVGICATVNQPNCTFYGRIITYSTAGATVSTHYVSNDLTGGATLTPEDAGGIALSTAAQITVTAKVQEQITFCVFAQLASGGAAGCGSANTADNHEAAPSVGLGSSPNNVLSFSSNYTNDDVNYQIQTNAGGNAVIAIYGSTLTSPTAHINGITGSASLVNGGNIGTSQFGLCSAKVHTGSGTFTITAVYNGGAVVCAGITDAANGDNGNDFFFDSASATTLASTDTLATAAAGTYDQGNVGFAANIPVTQTAGVYTANLGLVANGTY